MSLPTCYLGHLLRLPRDRVVRRTPMTTKDGGNRYLEVCQGSELKDIATLAVNRTAWRHKLAKLVF